jgi:hypothetical protein
MRLSYVNTSWHILCIFMRILFYDAWLIGHHRSASLDFEILHSWYLPIYSLCIAISMWNYNISYLLVICIGIGCFHSIFVPLLWIYLKLNVSC